MALATTYPFSKFLILLGDGGSPEVFSDPCGLTTKGFTRTANMNDTNIPDCTNPDLPSWLGRDVVSYASDIRGTGIVAKESINTWENWWQAGTTKNIQIQITDTPTPIKWQGGFKLQEFGITADRGQKVQMTVNIVSDGAVAKLP